MKRILLFTIVMATLGLPRTALAQSWAKIACGGEFSIGIKADGSLWGWGLNTNGQIGIGGTVSQPLPTRIGTDKDWKDIAAGGMHVLALKKNGTLWAWGNGAFGEVGDGGTSSTNDAPEQIGTDSDWVNISAGYASSFAIKKSGKLYCWGFNYYGNLGDSDNSNLYEPHLLNTKATFKQVAAGSLHGMALATNGSIWAWGYGGEGELGQGVGKSTESPIQVGTDTDWIWITCGMQHSMALKKDSTLWSWGANTFGQAGQGANNNALAPTQVGTARDWKYVTAGSFFSFGLKYDGTLWAWGDNRYGEIGKDSIKNIYVPTKVDSSTEWIGISGSTGTLHTQTLPATFYGYSAIGLKSNYNGYCASGVNTNYQLGSGDTTEDLTFDCTLGIKTGIKDVAYITPGIKIYPNPVAENLIVDAPQNAGVLTFRLYDLYGRQLLNQEIVGGQADISVGELPAGTYIARTTSPAGGIVNIQKIMVNR